MSVHFLLRLTPWAQDSRTWGILSQGRAVRYQTDYILKIYTRLFQNVSTWDSRHITHH